MLRTGPKRKFIYAASGYIYVVGGLLSSAIMWLMDVKKDDKWIEQKPILWLLTERFQEVSIWLLLTVALIIFATALMKQMADPWVVEKLQFILDEYQDRVFKNLNVPIDHNRVTLFKYKRSLFFRRHWLESGVSIWGLLKTRRFCGDYLVPYMRSGHMTLNTKTIFYVDSENSAKSQGVAGMAWSKRGVVILPDLPELTSTSRPRTKESYASVTKSSVRFLERYLAEGRTPSRAMAAMPVECNGKLWGVIVLDSLDPLGVTAQSVEHYTLTVALIGHLLERA
ncbi:GAF domain-containing protein [Pseudomonas syringae]|nr:GAF domain-containing protein [Pseudomonas syringae]MCH5531585.1 GAF domain-containing protein [Pseudomonas syringae pv. syringae]MCH5541557.1 GAF domain-containing protein [Pseudomonas syringae pv. syringae]MCH5546570.1 GAF domain-containing protein [Pseudomonas syringae pv. syringae]MCH5604932.1 GAF domain-containing protein [Pseudomonas syringae pv. syringae]MCH5609916.1 GAF domain-containing protein [Pseudomonas syringae pv. syringae]